MQKLLNSSIALRLALVVASLVLLACEASSVVSFGSNSSAQPTTAKSQPTQAASSSKGSTAATVVPTGAAKASATQTPTASPTSSVAQVGQRIVVQGVALTVTKAVSLDTYGGKAADKGYKWVVATVTVENASNAKVTVEEEQFDYVDRNGEQVPGLLNGPSAPGTTGDSVVGYHSLIPGGKIENKTLPIQLKSDLVPGLRLMFTVDKANSILVNLGFPTGPTG